MSTPPLPTSAPARRESFARRAESLIEQVIKKKKKKKRFPSTKYKICHIPSGVNLMATQCQLKV